MRTLAVLNCQLTFTFGCFCWCSHVLVRVVHDSRSGTRPPMLCVSSAANSRLRADENLGRLRVIGDPAYSKPDTRTATGRNGGRSVITLSMKK